MKETSKSGDEGKTGDEKEARRTQEVIREIKTEERIRDRRGKQGTNKKNMSVEGLQKRELKR